MRARHRLLAIGLAAFTAMAAPVAWAQFVPPPQAPPLLPPTYQKGPSHPIIQQQTPRQLGARCATQAGVCTMAQSGQLGAACYCQTAYGVAYGQIYP